MLLDNKFWSAPLPISLLLNLFFTEMIKYETLFKHLLLDTIDTSVHNCLTIFA